jgi:esterase/lipase superfamily enzyme
MELLVFGHAGARMVVVPHLAGALLRVGGPRDGGRAGRAPVARWLQLFCVDSVDAESWYADWKWPGDRAWRQMSTRVPPGRGAPLLDTINPNPFAMTAGASFGAYHAVNLALPAPVAVRPGDRHERAVRHPPLRRRARRRERGRQQPVALRVADPRPAPPGGAAADGHHPRHGRATIRSSRTIATSPRALWEKGVGNALRIWDGWAHDWPWWRDMIRTYAGGHG